MDNNREGSLGADFLKCLVRKYADTALCDEV